MFKDMELSKDIMTAFEQVRESEDFLSTRVKGRLEFRSGRKFL